MPPRLASMLAIVAAVLVSSTSLLAHDFWLEPSSFRPKPGAPVEVRLLVGAHFLGDALPRDPAQFELFVAAGPDGVAPVPGRYGADPAGVIATHAPGLIVVGYRSRHAITELTADTFTTYLADEGLERVAAVRAAHSRPDGRIREVFSRCAKALLLSGPAAATDRDRVLGFTLELVSESNPYSMRAGDSLPLRLLYEGKPLEGALVVAMSSGDPHATVRARADHDGRVSLRLPREGAWLVKAVHMTPAAPGTDADWESFWASLTFELPPAPAPRGVKKRG